MSRLRPGSSSAFPHLWGDEGLHYAEVSGRAKSTAQPGRVAASYFVTVTPASVFLPRRSTAIPPGRRWSPTSAVSASTFALFT